MLIANTRLINCRSLCQVNGIARRTRKSSLLSVENILKLDERAAFISSRKKSDMSLIE